MQDFNPEELASSLISSIIRRDFGYSKSDPHYEHHLNLFTKIVGRMHTNEENRIRDTYREMVSANETFKILDSTDQDDVIFWMLVITFGANFDLEYHSEGVLVNARACEGA